MTPEQRAYYEQATATMPKPDWFTAWTELHGYVTQAAAEPTDGDARLIAEFMAELKRRYVTGPVVEWIREQTYGRKP